MKKFWRILGITLGVLVIVTITFVCVTTTALAADNPSVLAALGQALTTVVQVVVEAGKIIVNLFETAIGSL